jgi:hypothetical protein
VTIPILEETSPSTTSSGESRLLSTSSNQSVLIARTRTESVNGRASPYNIIETSTEEADDDDHQEKSVDDDEVILNEEENGIEQKLAENTLSPSSSLTSGTDVYMDAVEILNDEHPDNKSGKRYLFFKFYFF